MPDCLILPKYHEFPRITTIERTFSWAAAWSSNLGIWYIDTSIPLRIGIQYGLSFTMIQFCSCFSPDMSLNFLSKAALYPELPAVEVLELSSLDICYVSTHKPPTFEFQLQTTDPPHESWVQPGSGFIPRHFLESKREIPNASWPIHISPGFIWSMLHTNLRVNRFIKQ